MRCPLCGGEFKDAGRQKGGQTSRRKLSKRKAKEMAILSAKAKAEKKFLTNKSGYV